MSRGQRLRRLREQRGIEQREAATAIGVSQPYLSLLERDRKGRHVAHVRGTLERAASFYGVALAYLLCDEPQEYVRAWVDQVDAPPSAGQRLRVVLDELQLRWGSGFTEAEIAGAIGTTLDVLRDYLADRVPVTDTVAAQLSGLTGAPAEWLVPRPTCSPGADHAVKIVVERAIASGMDPKELQALIDIWLAGKNAKKPPG